MNEAGEEAAARGAGHPAAGARRGAEVKGEAGWMEAAAAQGRQGRGQGARPTRGAEVKVGAGGRMRGKGNG